MVNLFNIAYPVIVFTLGDSGLSCDSCESSRSGESGDSGEYGLCCKSVDLCEYGDSGNLDELNDFVEYCQNSDFGMVPLVVPADMVILVIQVNLVIGEYDITWDSGDPGEFGDSGYFYEPADSCASDYFSKTVNSDS